MRARGSALTPAAAPAALTGNRGPSPIGALRSVQNLRGWYSNHKKKFMKFDNSISFLQSYKYSSEIQHDIFDERRTNLPRSFIEKFPLFNMRNQDVEDLTTIFEQYSNIIMSSDAKESAYEGMACVMKEFCLGLAKTSLCLKKQFQKLFLQFSANLSINKMLEIVKNLDQFEYFTEDKSTIKPTRYADAPGPGRLPPTANTRTRRCAR